MPPTFKIIAASGGTEISSQDYEWETSAGQGIMMTGFNTLDIEDKIEILRTEATFVGVARHYHYIITLYSWDRFFIEQYYDSDLKQITRITVADEQDMHKYLNNIIITDLPCFDI